MNRTMSSTFESLGIQSKNQQYLRKDTNSYRMGGVNMSQTTISKYDQLRAGKTGLFQSQRLSNNVPIFLQSNGKLTNREINTINARITTPILRSSLGSSKRREDASEKEAGIRLERIRFLMLQRLV